MKYFIGIVLVLLLMAALVLYILLILNAHDMTFCGDITNKTEGNMMITRVYTTDLNADETLSEIVKKMNDSEDAQVTGEELTEILATYQNIIYAPVFMLQLEQADTSTYVLSGAVYNGVSEDNKPIEPDYLYRDLELTAAIQNGAIIAAQNVYPLSESGEEGFIERAKVVDPIVTDENRAAAFAFRDCDSFRMVFKATEEQLPAAITLVYTYNIKADNPLDFTGLEGGVLAYTLTVNYDENGVLDPILTEERTIVVESGSENKQ